MKRLKTPDPEILLNPASGIYYYRKGSVEVSLRTKDFKEALDLKVLEKAKIDDTGSQARKLRVASVYPEYCKEKEKQMLGKLHKKKQISIGTFNEIKHLMDRHLLPYFGKMKLSEIDERKWSKYIHSAKVSDLSNHRKVFSLFLKWCKIKGYRKSMPDITEIPHHERRARRILKAEEIRAIFTFAQGRLLLFLALALFMGMRRKEIMTLQWSRINFEFRFLEVEKMFNKKRRAREIPLNAGVLKLLRLTKQEQDIGRVNTPWVFPNTKDPKRHADVSGLKTAWMTCLKKAFPKGGGEVEDITWHDLRATYEKFSNKSTAHTDTQKEKFADASIAVQKRIYVSMTADDLRGLEDVVQVEGLDSIIIDKIDTTGKPRGKTKTIKALNGTSV